MCFSHSAWSKKDQEGTEDMEGDQNSSRIVGVVDFLNQKVAAELEQILTYPPVIKHGNGKYTIYRWCSNWSTIQRGFSIAMFDYQKRTLSASTILPRLDVHLHTCAALQLPASQLHSEVLIWPFSIDALLWTRKLARAQWFFDLGWLNFTMTSAVMIVGIVFVVKHRSKNWRISELFFGILHQSYLWLQ